MKSIFHEETDSEWSVDLNDPKHNRRFIQVPRKPVGTGQSKLRDPDMVTQADGKVIECFPFTNDPLPAMPCSPEESPYREDSGAGTGPSAEPSTSPDTRPARSFSVSRKPVQYGVQTPTPVRTRGYTESDVGGTMTTSVTQVTNKTPPLGSEGFSVAGARPKSKHSSMRESSKADLSKALSKIGIKPSGSSRDLPTDPDELQASREEHIRDSYAALERVRDSRAVQEFYAAGGEGEKEKEKEKGEKWEKEKAKEKEKEKEKTEEREKSRSRSRSRDVIGGGSQSSVLERLSEESLSSDKRLGQLGEHLTKKEVLKSPGASTLEHDGISDATSTEKHDSDNDSDSDCDTQSFVKLPSADIHPVYGGNNFSTTPYATAFETPLIESTSTFGAARSRSCTPPSGQLLDASPTKTTNVTPRRVPVDHPSLHSNPEGRFLIDSCPEQELKRESSSVAIPPKGYKYPIDDRFPAAVPRQSSPPADPYQEIPEPYDCWNEEADRKSPGAPSVVTRHPYYRYFVMRFSRDLYLTTTPTQHHMVANQAQSYYVKNEDYRFMFYTNINEQPVTIVEKRDNFLQICYDDSSRPPLEDYNLSSTVSLEQSIDSQSLSESLSDIVNPSFVGQAIEIPCGDKGKNKKYKRYSFIDELGQEWFITNEKSGVYTFSNANSVVATYKRKENIGKRIVKNGLEWLSQQESNKNDNYRALPSAGPQPVASSIETEASATLTVSELVDPSSNLWKICIGLLVTVAYKKPKQ
ncbi:hypothetical protein B0I72DRAFT_142039 [Yarrowia lipolytica]|uniref:YALI0E25806p n=2 Tax=Yarrowia lipolytica TaxID=4952 RepID=Q6C4L4_YARLI|nr:YALI0E25806p [Yarrowia lipolytica CLIB122]AOW05963.1 hypothetical protein YALI1_E30590g [Yarrowia lipolytica]KAB8280119.1 hypothetical protein BKA91DRAFT_142487 [Yarrowia lipolytica]KAE8169054.1 hypothetical protein BKA90DRAFT_143254 [Yarrowia lipolytica]KAJ8057374.1 hypothetical protein LXG23DRAFT_54077 [Yarrowia lipolytica]QNP99195.1 Hypothetical protein YALI2_E00511g [Yarrowia lipolytica]|eukprot:XP_504398.1 YALI0E25806p [Yarrowia lipolytica CLIB122]